MKNDRSGLALAFSSFQYPQYRWLFAGSLVFFFAMQGQILTRSVLVWQLTHDEMSLALVNLAVAVPLILASVIGGAVTDRFDKRQITMLGQSLVVINEGLVLILLLSDQLEFWHMLLTSFVTGCAIPFIMPARMAIIYDIVGTKHLANALALSAGGMNTARVAGPATMGILIHILGIEGVYIIALLLYSLAVLFMFGVSPGQKRKKSPKPLTADIREGFSYVINHKQVLVCLLFGLIPMFLAMPFLNLLVVFSDEVFKVGERGFGMMMAAAGTGGVIGSYWMAHRGNNPHRLRLMLLTALGFAACLALFSLSSSFNVALCCLVVANIFASACQTLNTTAVQLLVDDEVRGRVSSFVIMSLGFMPLGVLPLAYAAKLVGAPTAVLFACGFLVIAVLSFTALSQTLRNLDAGVQEALTRRNKHSP